MSMEELSRSTAVNDPADTTHIRFQLVPFVFLFVTCSLSGVHPVEYDPDYPVVIAKLKKNQVCLPSNLAQPTPSIPFRGRRPQRRTWGLAWGLDRVWAGDQVDGHCEEGARTDARQVVPCKASRGTGRAVERPACRAEKGWA